MRSYLSLIPISARVHRRQSRMTRICIILAVFLVTALFSIADIFMASETDAMIAKHGNYHILLQHVPETEAASIGKRADIEMAVWCDEINEDVDKEYTIDGKTTVLYGMEASYMTDIRGYATEGALPQSDSEVMLSTDAKTLFGIGVGDPVTLHTPAGAFNYTVSGFCEDDSSWNQMFDGCCVYMNRTALQAVGSLNAEDTNPKYYIRFAEKTNISQAIAEIKQQYALAAANIDENTAVLGLLGGSSNESVNAFYPLLVLCFVLILLAGVLMISGCINSTVAQRISFFGMLRCIGASKQQIIRYVRLESLSWCITAIPTGCVLGIVTTWILCAILRLLVKGEWAYMRLFGTSVPGIVCGIAVGLITVFLAAHAPAKRAAAVSPIAAVSGNTGTTKTVSRASNTRLMKIETNLGMHHATGDKKNLILIAGSFALTIILFLTFSVCLDFARRLIPSMSDFSPDLSVSSETDTNSIDQQLAADIAETPGVEHVFGTMYAIALPAKINGTETTIDLVSYEQFMLSNAEKAIASGDLSQVYGDSDYALTVFNKDSRLDVGDKITIGGQTIEIACVVSEGIGSLSDAPIIVCSEETFTRLTGEQGYLMVNIILGKDATDKTVQDIRHLAGEHIFTDRRQEDHDIKGSYWVIRLAAYGFLMIISLIAVLNIMNSISMSVSARIRQYGAMRAVGMENRQVTKMITAEAVTYAVYGMVIGDILGLLLHYVFYKTVIITHFGGSWSIPIIPLVVIALLIAASCILAVHAPAKRIRDMAITDTINEL